MLFVKSESAPINFLKPTEDLNTSFTYLNHCAHKQKHLESSILYLHCHVELGSVSRTTAATKCTEYRVTLTTLKVIIFISISVNFDLFIVTLITGACLQNISCYHFCYSLPYYREELQHINSCALFFIKQQYSISLRFCTGAVLSNVNEMLLWKP